MSVERSITALGEEKNSHKERKDRKEGRDETLSQMSCGSRFIRYFQI